MSALTETLATIRRPRLLVRAARHGLEEYNRNRDLRRILRGESLPAPSDALPRLMDMEAAHEQTRKRGDASYSIARHLEILIALMAESRLVGRASPPA
jgi:plasmid stability protein